MMSGIIERFEKNRELSRRSYQLTDQDQIKTFQYHHFFDPVLGFSITIYHVFLLHRNVRMLLKKWENESLHQTTIDFPKKCQNIAVLCTANKKYSYLAHAIF